MMRELVKIYLALIYISMLTFSGSVLASVYMPGEVLVSFHPGTPGAAKQQLHQQMNGNVIKNLNAINVQLIKVAKGSEHAKATAYQKNPNVKYAEPNYIRPLIVPIEGVNPPPQSLDFFKEQWALNNTGQAFYYDQFSGAFGALTGVIDADIDAPEGWDIHTGSDAITVAILDTGVECTHADMQNTCVEQVNFGPSTTIDDVLGHGTHVAGIVAANTNNGFGTAGISWHAKIASLKVCYEYNDFFYGLIGLCDSAASAQAMIYAADQGYQVANMSYGGPQGSQVEADAATYAFNNGVVLVAAAGNEYSMSVGYPGSYPEVMAVAASDYYDNLAGFSNFGPGTSVLAPGDTIFSTLKHADCGLTLSDPGGCFGWKSGTSMASPVVAGVAAVVWAHLLDQSSSTTSADVRQAIEANADQVGALGQNMLAYSQHGRVNLYSALTNASPPSPPPPPPPPPPPEEDPGIHIGDLDGSVINAGKNWQARATVRVHDENENLVSGALVSGTWSGGTSGNGSCTTSGSGVCTVTSSSMRKNRSSATFTVNNVSDGGVSQYNFADNHDPDSDSNGSTITIAK